jgi:hypothetical protein
VIIVITSHSPRMTVEIQKRLKTVALGLISSSLTLINIGARDNINTAIGISSRVFKVVFFSVCSSGALIVVVIIFSGMLIEQHVYTYPCSYYVVIGNSTINITCYLEIFFNWIDKMSGKILI